jgi:hypothetical protein
VDGTQVMTIGPCVYGLEFHLHLLIGVAGAVMVHSGRVNRFFVLDAVSWNFKNAAI